MTERPAKSAIWRLTAVFAAAFALGAALFVGGAWWLIESKNAQQLQALIEADLDAVVDKLDEGPPEVLAAKATALVLARSARPGDPRRYRLLRDGVLVAGSDERLGPHALTHHLGDGVILVVDRRSDTAGVGREMLAAAAIALAVAALGAFVVGPWASGRLLARVDAINRALDRVRAGALSTRAPGAEIEDEFGALSRHVNAMLERIDSLVTGLKDVSNRVAHDLRTPMARLKSDLEAAARATSLQEARERAALAAVETDEILQTFEALLDIAEAEAGSDGGFEPMDLGEAVQAAVDLYAAVAEDRGVRLDYARAPAMILGERLLVVRLAANLLDNAVKFSPAGGRVAVEVAAAPPGEAVLTVADQGPGVAPAEREQVMRRFGRGAAAPGAPGHGLGLALVAAVAKRHGAKIAMADAGPGLRIAVRFSLFQPTRA